MLTCPSCGQDNPDEARFCLACGTSLRAGTVRDAEERKMVSVLFVDLVDFTARSDNADLELDLRAREIFSSVLAYWMARSGR